MRVIMHILHIADLVENTNQFKVTSDECGLVFEDTLQAKHSALAETIRLQIEWIPGRLNIYTVVNIIRKWNEKMLQQ